MWFFDVHNFQRTEFPGVPEFFFSKQRVLFQICFPQWKIDMSSKHTQMSSGTKDQKLLYKVKLYKSKEKSDIIILLPKAKCLNHMLYLHHTWWKVQKEQLTPLCKIHLSNSSLFETFNPLTTCIQIPALPLTSFMTLGMLLPLSVSVSSSGRKKIQLLVVFLCGLNADPHIINANYQYCHLFPRSAISIRGYVFSWKGNLPN